MSEEGLAVEVMSGWKRYSSRTVLKGISIKVPQGSIYGLLGPSGCGKTTLLSSLVGKVTLDSGQIKMTVTSKAEIGFMPQDITLFPDMNIKEHLSYYGRLYAMPVSLIGKRAEDLSNFLQLPSLNSVVKILSGGQQRRVSLCITLLHSPQLIILDEPTVGVDVMLAHSIWEKLQDMSAKEGKTIIITTHYIEEARRSNTIGLMRNGQLLAEEEPGKLMEVHGCDSLEETFLKLCVREDSEPELTQSADSVSNKKPRPHLRPNKPVTLHRINAHILKNIYWMRRNIPMLLFTFLLPILQCWLASVTIGEKPTGLSLALVNDELSGADVSRCGGSRHWLGPIPCHQRALPISCFISQKLYNKSIKIVTFESLEEAEESVRRNYQWGLVHFNSKFSVSLQERVRNIQSLRNESVLSLSQMDVRLDYTNQVISNSLKLDIITSLLEAVFELSDNCYWRAAGASSPFKIEEPVFGTKNPSIRQYMTPANAILFEFYFPVLFTVSVLIDEKASGLLDRSLIAGLGLFEILIGHIVMQYAVLLVQTGLEWYILFYFFDNPILPGSFPSCFFLLLLIATCGMFYAFAIVYQSSSFTEAAVLTFGGYFPIFILSGAVWPVEGMHHVLRWVASCLPVTRGVEAFRSLSVRGWPYSHPAVYSSFIAVLLWSLIYCAICLITSIRRGVKL